MDEYTSIQEFLRILAHNHITRIANGTFGSATCFNVLYVVIQICDYEHFDVDFHHTYVLSDFSFNNITYIGESIFLESDTSLNILLAFLCCCQMWHILSTITFSNVSHNEVAYISTTFQNTSIRSLFA